MLRGFVRAIALLAAVTGAAAEGGTPTVILADETTILSVFRDSDEEAVRRFAGEIAVRSDGVVLHLGRRDVFRRGSPFFYRSSRRNLKVFCEAMKAEGKKVYLWSLDSFGAASFLGLAEGLREAIAEDVADLEWINFPEGDNAGRLLEVLGFLRELLPRRQLLLFAPLIDDPAENIRRGYPEGDLLRVVDGTTEAIRAGETVHWLRILDSILQPDDLLWEYTLWRP